MSQAGVYRIVNLANGKMYIGSSVNIGVRWRLHRSTLDRGIHHSDHLQKAWNKYGSQSFAFEIIFSALEVGCLLEIEQMYLDLHVGNLYNIAKIAGAPTRGVKQDPEVVARRASANRGKKRPQYAIDATANARRGKPLSQEQKAKLSAYMKGRKPSPETIAKIVAKNLGKKRSPEFCAASSARQKGKKLSDEHKMNLAAAQKRRFERERNAAQI